MSANSVTSDSEDSDGFIITNNPTRDCSDCPPLSVEELAKVREWLEPTAYDISGGEYRKHTSSYLSGTGSWLTASSEYQQWLTGQDHGLLWIKGIPGSGKSVMAAKIIADLTTSEPKSPVLYFFFRQIIDANHEPAALLRDWMDQLLQHSPVLQRQLYSHVKGGESWKSVSQDDMWKYLKTAFASLSEMVFCVTDALDEMDQGNDTFLQALANLGHWRPDKVKVLITSRPVSSVETPLHLVPCLKIRLREDEVDNDISRFVMHSLETSQIDKRHWPTIIDAVPGRANGLFLYARLAMDAFLEPGADVETALAHLPIDLNVLYTNLLREHISRSGVDEAVQKLILQAVTHATRPLRLLEIAEMLSVVDTERDLKARKELVKAACGPLLEILADETVSVIHHSFTEYLKGITRLQADSGYPPLAYGAAHEQLASACLRYLCSGVLDSFPAHVEDLELYEARSYLKLGLWKKHPFLKYATGSWFKHVVAACSASSDDTRILAETCRFLDNDSWRLASCRLERQFATWDAPKAHVAAKWGLTGYIKLLIEHAEDVDSVDRQGRTPLWWAASEGHADTVQVLIAAGAKPDGGNATDGYTPLHQAAKANHFSVVELLLRAGVSPMIRKGLGSPQKFSAHCMPSHGESPLRCACEKGHLQTVDAMMKYIMDLGKTYWALAWAACSGQSRLVSLLLEYPGVDVNAKVRGDTFLYLACYSLDIETISILLRAGADPTVLSIGDQHPMNVDIDYTPEPTGCPTQSCLRAITESYRLEGTLKNLVAGKGIEKLFSNLFLAGLDVNQRDSTGQTLLHRVTGSAELTQLLLSEGADATAVDDKKNTPLHFAVKPDVISILVKIGGANVNAVDMNGQTPLHRATSHCHTTLHRAKSLATISKLLEYGADPNMMDNKGNTVLHLLLWLTTAATLHEHVALLLRFGADPNMKNHDGLTPLRRIRNVHTAGQVVDCLIQAGADIDSRDNTGRTALFDAVGQQSFVNQNSICILEFLLDVGASKRSRDFKGRKMAHGAIRGAMCQNDIGRVVQWLDALDSLELLDLEAVDNAGNSLLHELCSHVQNTLTRRTVEMHLIRLLTGAGLDISRKNYAGHTPLHLLCARPCEQGGSWYAFDLPIAYAIQKCKNIDERDSSGNTALHIASAYEQTWCKLLLDAGADPTLRNHDGLTPLHLAARCKQSNVVGMLLKAVRDRLGDAPSDEAAVINAIVINSCYNIYEPFHLTALFYACQSGRPESVKLLLDAGADPNIGTLFVACAMMEQENRLWEAKDPSPVGDIAALRLFDTKRPPKPPPAHRTDLFYPFVSTRLEEILDMLFSAGIKLSLLCSDPSRGHTNPFAKAASLHSDYAYTCFNGIKTKHSEKMEEVSECVTSRDPMRGLSTFDGRMVALRQNESERMIKQSGWLQPEGIDFEIFRAIIVRRQYHLIAPMVEAGCRFLLPGIPHLQYLIVHGLASVFNQIVEAETQSRLSEGEWHAFGDPSKPGLHFRPKLQQDEAIQNGNPREEFRNKMLEYAVGRALPNMEIVELLVTKYAVNINEGHRGNNTALHTIARGHHWWQGAQALPFLIKSGADIESRNLSGQTPLHLALERKKGGALGELGPFHKDVAEALINAGADMNAIDSKGQSCLDVAGYSTELIDLLISNGAVIHASSIFSALKADNSAALEKLLNGGADANGRMPFVEDDLREKDDMDGFCLGDSRMTFDTALVPHHEIVPVYYMASKSAFPEDADMRSCFRKLLEHGADIYAPFQVQPEAHSFRGSTRQEDYNRMLGLADEHATAPEERSVLHELVRLGKLSKCIIDAVDINTGCRDPKGCTLLHAVCDSWNGPDSVIDMTSDDDDDDDGEEEVADQRKEGHMTAFQQLLTLGCDIRARDNSGQSVVHHMIYRGWKYPEKLGRLEKSMAEVARLAPELLNAPNASGNTPFHYSALLTASARRPAAVSREGDEPRRTEQTAMVNLTRLLLRLGASPAGVNDDGNSVLHFLAPNLDRYDVTALFTELVRDHGLDVNARNGLGETPLTHLANRTGALLRLCGGGQPQLCPDDYAAAEAVAALKALGADFGVVDARTGDGLLHLAATDAVQLFKAVMDCGGLDPARENKAHQTAIDVAATYNNKEILALFEKKV